MKIITNAIALLVLAGLIWACTKALVPAIDAELAAQAATAREYQQLAIR